MNKNVLNRIEKLEKNYITEIFDKEEYLQEIVKSIEYYLHYSIQDRIKYNEIDFTTKESASRCVFRFLNIEELKAIVYYNEDNKTVKN